jgi:hypothetical protein
MRPQAICRSLAIVSVARPDGLAEDAGAKSRQEHKNRQARSQVIPFQQPVQPDLPETSLGQRRLLLKPTWGEAGGQVSSVIQVLVDGAVFIDGGESCHAVSA